MNTFDFEESCHWCWFQAHGICRCSGEAVSPGEYCSNYTDEPQEEAHQ